MPKYTIDTVIKKAIYPATLDRIAMLDADPGRESEIRKEIEEIKAIDHFPFVKMTDKQTHTAMMALTYAEQWEAGLAESLGLKGTYGKDGREADRKAKMFQTYRHRYFGKNALEDAFDRSTEYRMGADGKFRSKEGKLMPTRSYLNGL